ncbi:MAG: tyrosine-type recombinase/integrase [Negativicoccus succinicivorans]|nr:tyrosine-type recombinase/integrase [Negativicoccus succinicivorans]
MRFLWANTDNILHKIVLIQCYTGTRSNELQKMLIKNANLTKQYMISGSKTEAGKNRIIPIADCMLPFIKEFYRKSMFKKSKYLFTPEKGIPSIRGTLDFLEIYKKLRLKNRHLSHDARHIFITLSSNYHIDDIIVKLIVGHAQSDITKEVYTHKRKEQLLSAVNFLPHGKSMIFCPDDFGSHLVATE